MMDNRDALAAMALTGMLAHSRGKFEGHIDRGGEGHFYGRMFGYRSENIDWHVAISEEAYELANAMLEAGSLEDE